MTTNDPTQDTATPAPTTPATPIQHARDILAKWRTITSQPMGVPYPWTIQNAVAGRKNWDDVLVDGDGDWVFSYDQEVPNQDEVLTWNKPGSADPAVVCLIVGTAGNRELLDAIDGFLVATQDGVAQGFKSYPGYSYAERIAAAIIAADERMSA